MWPSHVYYLYLVFVYLCFHAQHKLHQLHQLHKCRCFNFSALNRLLSLCARRVTSRGSPQRSARPGPGRCTAWWRGRRQWPARWWRTPQTPAGGSPCCRSVREGETRDTWVTTPDLHLHYIKHSANDFFPRRLTVHLSEERETIYRCRFSKDFHRNKCQALTIIRLTNSPLYNKDS